MLRRPRKPSEDEASEEEDVESEDEEEEEDSGSELSTGRDAGATATPTGLELPVLYADITKAKYPVIRKCVKYVGCFWLRLLVAFPAD